MKLYAFVQLKKDYLHSTTGDVIDMYQKRASIS